MNLSLFWEITRRSYQRYLTYRAATLAGLVTNFFFGILRASILVALYGLKTEMEGISLQGAITYAAMTQAIIGYLNLFGWFDLMETVYTGEIATDLLKPMNFIGYWMARDLGRAAMQLLFRGLVVMAGYALLFDLTWAQGITQWLALGVVLFFSWMLSFFWRFLINLAAFWTPNARGILRFFFVFSWFFSGFLMPLRFFPDWIIKLSYLTPFPHMLNTVVEVYLGVLQGTDLIQALLLQVFWIIGLLLTAQLTLRAGVRRLVILEVDTRTMRHSLFIYRRLIGVQIRSQMMYRTSFFMEVFGTGLTTLAEYASLALVFTRFDNLGGWKLGHIAFLYGLAELSFGIMDMVFSGFDPSHFGMQVRRGTFDQILLRPLNITLQVMGSEFTLRRIGKIAISILIFITALELAPVDWTPTKGTLTIIAVISQVFFFGGLFIIGATISFWTVDSIEAINILTYGGSYMISHPMHVFPDALRRFFTFIIPAAFLNYYPAMYILEIPDPTNMPEWVAFLVPFAGLFLFAAALAFWRFGINHYQSTGT